MCYNTKHICSMAIQLFSFASAYKIQNPEVGESPAKNKNQISYFLIYTYFNIA